MPRGIRSEGLAKPSSATGAGSVALEFCGVFRCGPREGQLFAGTIRYAANAVPSECHSGYTQFDDWASPVMTVMVAGQQVAADSVSVYAAVPDGAGAAMDMVTVSGVREVLEPAVTVEAMFASVARDRLDPRRMPTAAQFEEMMVKRLYYATAGESPSTGDLLFGPSN